MSRPALTPEQARAVNRPPADVCVVASAGAGKTTVLTERYVSLVKDHGRDVRRVAALTFTNKAADEMRERIATAFAGPSLPSDARERAPDVEFAPISTINAYCARLLKEHAVDAGVDPAFAVLDETEADLLLEDAYAAVERRWRAARDPRHRVLFLLGNERVGDSVRGLLDRLLGEGIDPAEARWLRDGGASVPPDRLEGPLRDLLVAVNAEYLERKRARNALDFADVESRALALLDRLAAKGRRLERAPTDLLVDEYQDVNPIQARIFARLAGRNGPGTPVPQFSVGDAKQSIYRFRRADVRAIVAERERVGRAGEVVLTESFRARPELVAFQNAFFARVFEDGAAGVPFEPMVARAAFHEHPPIPVEVVVTDAGKGARAEGRREAEARTVAATIRGWIDSGARRTKKEKGPDGAWTPTDRPLRWGDVAVLLRSRTGIQAYERAFLAAWIPFHLGRGAGFYATEEIEDLLHLLRVVHDPEDRFALAAWLAGPAVGATDADLLATFSSGGSPYAAAASSPALRPAVERIEALRRLSATASVADVVARAVEAFDAVPIALLQSGGLRRARNLARAVEIARRSDAQGAHGLPDFLRRISDLRERKAREEEAGAGLGEEDSVALATVHSAKGLQWPCVVLADAGAQAKYDSDPFVTDGGGGFAMKVRDPLEGTADWTCGGEAARKEASGLARAESLRLLYVALTRAEERLVVSIGATGKTKKGGWERVREWGTTVLDALPAVRHAGALVAERVVDGGVSLPPAPTAPLPDVDDRVARALWTRARRPVETLGRTPYVATISELVAFARGAGSDPTAPIDPPARVRLRAEPDDPAGAVGSDPTRPMDDPALAVVDGIDRAALGRAVHLAIERYEPGADVATLVARAVAQEFEGGAPGAAIPLAVSMVQRFLASEAGRATVSDLAAGRTVRREVAFHARVRFAQGRRVAGFDGLLVKGTIDLWLSTEKGPRILDHKTNSPTGRLSKVEALRDHYATQVRLYALAAERLEERDVLGAGLLLLDPAWDSVHPAVEVPVDVSGDRLLETRELCRAYAIACHEERRPADWRSLL